jgi:signal transduction histidine kinase
MSSLPWYAARFPPRALTSRQLFLFEQMAAPARLDASTRFMGQELPARLHALQGAGQSLPPHIRALPCMVEWGQRLGSLCEPHAHAAVACPRELSERALEAEAALSTLLSHCAAGLQQHVATAPGYQREAAALHAARGALNGFFDHAYALLHGLRSMATLHSRALPSPPLSSSQDGHAAGGAEAAAVDEVPPLVANHDVCAIAEHAIADTRAFAREKFGVVPDVTLAPPPPADGVTASSTVAMCQAAHVGFILHELLKNAMMAHSRAYGIDADLGPEVEVSLWRGVDQRYLDGAARGAPRLLHIRVRDYGPGMQLDERSRALAWLTTQVEDGEGGLSRRLDNEPHWKYTREMGSQLSGFGVGLPLSRSLARSMGGDLALSTHTHEHEEGAGGLDATITIDATGLTTWFPT